MTQNFTPRTEIFVVWSVSGANSLKWLTKWWLYDGFSIMFRICCELEHQQLWEGKWISYRGANGLVSDHSSFIVKLTFSRAKLRAKWGEWLQLLCFSSHWNVERCSNSHRIFFIKIREMIYDFNFQTRFKPSTVEKLVAIKPWIESWIVMKSNDESTDFNS